MAKEPGKDEGSSSLRDALRNKMGGAPDKLEMTSMPGTMTTPHSGGTVPGAPAEDSILQQPLSFGQPNNLQRAIFCRQFATLIEVGIPVLKALQMLSVRTSQRKLREAIAATAKGVHEGQAIHQAMTPYSNTFTPLVVNIVRIGETGGILQSSLQRLADIMESKTRIKRKIVAASMYPIVALCVAIGVVVLILLKAIPVFKDVYGSAGKALPLPTQIVIKLSDFLVSAWPVLLVLAALAVWGLMMWGKTPSGKRVYSWLALRLPIFKGINQKIAVARSTRTLGGLVTAGIPLIEAISITSDTNENVLVSDALREVHDQVEKGERMALPLSKADVFPPIVVDMIAIGEETGTLDRMLHKVADIYDTEVDTMLTGLSSIIEPLLIIVLGGVVMFIALAVLLPYFRISTVVNG